MSGDQSRVSRLVLPVGDRDHIAGAPDVTVTLLEYGDYQCPYCGEAYPVVKALRQRPGLAFRFAFRNFPLSEIHPRAEMAAEAAEAAGAQGRFWEMHDRLFEHQKELDAAGLMKHARALRLDVKRFAAELEEGMWEGRVREDFMSGVRSGVNGTPTFFINGARYDGEWDLENLALALQAAAG